MNPTPLSQLINLSGKTALITGGAMGIGLGIARRFAEAGATVVLVDINDDIGTAAAEGLKIYGGKAMFIHADVADEDQVRRAIADALSAFGAIDILVNNAGIYPMIPTMKMELKDFETIVAVNLRSVFLFTKAVAEVMISKGRGGKIINITSIDALHPSAAGLAAYDASKHGMWGFTKNTALELAPHNIQVNAIAPGAIATPGTGAGKPTTPEMEAVLNRFLQKIPMGRMGEPDDIGKVALFLASEFSSYMTGTQVVVDGGALLA